MNERIQAELTRLQELIESDAIPEEALKATEWGGADVVIKQRVDDVTKKWLGNQPEVISLQETEPKRRAIITDAAKQLSWLFANFTSKAILTRPLLHFRY